ncbi:hypothetical protein HYX00_05330 [Candidatus Woesearchaeota archaeon]|nr:hypothetical protein [Candidatus Woesearchaeota archaeon]
MITKIFASRINLGILKGLLQSEKKIIATKLTSISKLRRIPSEELDVLASMGLIDSEKKGKKRYLSLTEKGKVAIKKIIEIEQL